MRRWLHTHAHQVRMTSEVPASDPEGQFWATFEGPLGGRDWRRVEQLLGKRTARLTTLAGWHAVYQAVDAALKAEAAVV